jgi:crotonobetainyl-CoA:carnitine CoA-transferase CaiB-like acyl-CoA transferase
VVDMQTPEGQPLRLLGNPLKMSATPVRLHRLPPHLDQDREDVFQMLRDFEEESAP